MAFEKIIARLDGIAAAPSRVAEKAAPKIATKLRLDATTRRGNVPQFAPGAAGHAGGNVPIAAHVEGSTINVVAPGWVIDKAIEKDQIADWIEIVQDTAREEMGK